MRVLGRARMSEQKFEMAKDPAVTQSTGPITATTEEVEIVLKQLAHQCIIRMY